MLRIFRNAMVGGAAAVTIFAGTATADNNWTITVNNKSKTPADVTIRQGSPLPVMLRPDGIRIKFLPFPTPVKQDPEC